MRDHRAPHTCIATAAFVAATILVSAPPTSAAPSPSTRCLAAKMRATTAEARSVLRCAGRALATGTDPACLASAASRRQAAFLAVEKRGGCAVVGDSAAIGAEIAALHDGLLATLRPGAPATSRCTSAQLMAALQTFAKIAQAYIRDDRAPDPARLAASVASAYAQFETAFDRATARGDCLSDADASAARTVLETAIAHVRATLVPVCGDGIRAGSEACDGATCPNQPTTELGCSGADTANACQCCATTAPCYVRGFGHATPVETPCCNGSCQIPGPEAGPDAIGHCSDEPPASCPCFDAASIDAAFPPGYFDENGRGGPLCMTDTAYGITTMGFCLIQSPIDPTIVNPRAAFGVVLSEFCVFSLDRDPGNTGFCPPLDVVLVTPSQEAACVAEVLASQAYQTTCP